MNPHIVQSTSFTILLRSIWLNRRLIKQMVQREVVGRYRGSILGIIWSFCNPLFMLSVYTFVFSVVFTMRWGGGDSKVQVAVLLYSGLVVHGMLAEVLNQAPSLIRSNVNYVKKVVFPLEILPIVSLGATLFHACVNLVVLLAAFLCFNGFVHWTVLFIPIVWFPLILATLGVGWLLASLGVYIRDISQLVGVLTTVLLFLAPVFYPLEAMPEKYQSWILLNPLTFIIQQSREVIIWGRLPDWLGLSIYMFVSVAVLWLGFWWFQKTRKGFADVL